jgi:hypothetical protein
LWKFAALSNVAVNTGSVSGRREVRFETMDDLSAEFERVVTAAKAGQVRPVGNW